MASAVIDVLSVTCPDDARAGELLYVTCPDGSEVEVMVPAGVEPGERFDVSLPPPPPPPDRTASGSTVGPVCAIAPPYPPTTTTTTTHHHTPHHHFEPLLRLLAQPHLACGVAPQGALLEGHGGRSSSYLQAGVADPELGHQLTRDQLIDLYEVRPSTTCRDRLLCSESRGCVGNHELAVPPSQADLHGFLTDGPPAQPPPHDFIQDQRLQGADGPDAAAAAAAAASQPLDVRVCQWNINGLLGLRWGGPVVPAAEVAELLLSWKCDVLLLQETANETNAWYESQGLGAAPREVAELDRLLTAAGYYLHRTPLNQRDEMQGRVERA